MPKALLALLDFKSPYHIGWRVSEKIIEGFTVHRALINTSVVIEGGDGKAKSIVELRASAALPAVLGEGCHKLLLPLPPVPSKVNLKKTGLRWMTMRAAYLMAKLAAHKLPYVTNMPDEKTGELTLVSDGTSAKLCNSGEVVRDCGERFDPPDRVLEHVEILLNRMDRITGAADVYRVTGYRPALRLGLVLQGGEDQLDYGLRLLRVLGELGIGGLRSRGFGRFTVETGALCDSELLSENRGPGQVVLLGSYILSESIDPSRSIVVRRLVEGLSGPPYDSYVLPYFSYFGAGSILRATRELSPVVLSVSGSHVGSTIVFNPVALGGDQ